MCKELYKVTTCDIIYSPLRPPQYTIIKLSPVWLSVEVQERIESLPIPLIKKETYNVSGCDIININIHWEPSNAD